MRNIRVQHPSCHTFPLPTLSVRLTPPPLLTPPHSFSLLLTPHTQCKTYPAGRHELVELNEADDLPQPGYREGKVSRGGGEGAARDLVGLLSCGYGEANWTHLLSGLIMPV